MVFQTTSLIAYEGIPSSARSHDPLIEMCVLHQNVTKWQSCFSWVFPSLISLSINRQMLSDLCSKLGLDLVPREGPLAVDPHGIGIVKLYNVHVSSADNAKASSV